MRDLDAINFRGKTILEIGSGRGGSAMELLDLIRDVPDSNIILTDIQSMDLTEFLRENPEWNNRLRFIQTDACELSGIRHESIDIGVGYNTLCAINAVPNKLIQALEKMYSVLKPGGLVYFEEEFPLSVAKSPHQKIWANQWQILKELLRKNNQAPNKEISPHALQKMLLHVGFKEVDWDQTENIFHAREVIPAFWDRIDYWSQALPQDVRSRYQTMAENWEGKMRKLQTMEIPVYTISGVK
jgi:ubiquinone/menaquinone biosynthesis C-methylase UbiE